MSSSPPEQGAPQPRNDPNQQQQQQEHHQHSLSFPGGRKYSAATQQALFQAYIHALRTGQIPMPNLSLANALAKAQQQANHNHTISDAKRGVTYVGQEQLKRLPIPSLEETCQRYL